jgi:hypothetical protein
MHCAALENIAQAKTAGSLHAPVIARNEDVVDYEIPQTPLVFFFFNGFDRVVLGNFVAKLAQSLGAHPRPCYFVYVNPKNGDLLEASGLGPLRFSRITRLAIRLLSPWPMAIYRNSPARDSSPGALRTDRQRLIEAA